MKHQTDRSKSRCGSPRLQAILLAIAGLACVESVHAGNQPLLDRTADRTQGSGVLVAQASKNANAASLAEGSADFNALIKAAKTEGEVTIYSAVPDGVLIRTRNAFFEKYGIRIGYVRLSSEPLTQRYFSEAEVGTFAADVIFTSGSGEPYVTKGIERGWIEPISKANLPVLRSGQFPSRFNDGLSPIIQLSLWVIGYNKDAVKGVDVPREWTDLLNPKWKGRIVVPDPRIGTAWAQFWQVIHDNYGDDFFTKLRAQDFRHSPGGVPAVQSVASGEAYLAAPVITSVVTSIQAKGAPIEIVAPSLTTGVQFHLVLTARDKAKHPNAARLLANYVMSPEGNKVFNDEPGLAGAYEGGNLPKRFILPKPATKEQIDRLGKLLGY